MYTVECTSLGNGVLVFDDVHERVQGDHTKRVHHGEDHPNINHLYVSSHRE